MYFLDRCFFMKKCFFVHFSLQDSELIFSYNFACCGISCITCIVCYLLYAIACPVYLSALFALMDYSIIVLLISADSSFFHKPMFSSIFSSPQIHWVSQDIHQMFAFHKILAGSSCEKITRWEIWNFFTNTQMMSLS